MSWLSKQRAPNVLQGYGVDQSHIFIYGSVGSYWYLPIPVLVARIATEVAYINGCTVTQQAVLHVRYKLPNLEIGAIGKVC